MATTIIKEDELDLIAPTYPAASAYQQPVPPKAELGVDDVSIADLLRAPAALAILDRFAPALVQAARQPAVQPYVEALTVRSMLANIPGDHGQLIAQIDATLRALPTSEKPYYDR